MFSCVVPLVFWMLFLAPFMERLPRSVGEVGDRTYSMCCVGCSIKKKPLMSGTKELADLAVEEAVWVLPDA